MFNPTHRLMTGLALAAAAVLAATPVLDAAPVKTWTSQRSGTEDLRGVSFASPDLAYAVGNSETVLAWDGTSWTSVADGPWAGTSDELLFAVEIISPTQVIAGGWNGDRQAAVYDGAGNWTGLFDAGPNTDRISEIRLIGPNLAVSTRSSGRLTTYNGGTITDDSNWTRRLNLSGSFFDVSSSSATNIVAVGSNGLVYRSTDGAGVSWSAVTVDASLTSQSWNGVTVLSDTEAWLVGDDGTIGFFDGTSVTTQASGTTQDLRDVFAIDSNTVYAVGTNGTILNYDGTGWSSVTLPFVVTDDLYKIDGDQYNVLIVGEDERIISGVVPEPSVLSLSGLMALGVLALRKR